MKTTYEIISMIGLLILSATFTASAQLANTAWEGVFMIPDAEKCVLNFKNDTIYLKAYDEVLSDSDFDNFVFETALYTISNDTLTMQKISGGSPCALDVVGKYHFEITDEGLLLTAIQDACPERIDGIPQNRLKKVEY